MDYDKDVFNITEGFDSEIKLNPDFYIHTGIISAQKAILLSTMEGKTKDGVNAYSIFVKQIQMIAESAGYLKEESIQTIKDFEQGKDLISLANNSSKALGIVLNDIFGHRPQYGSLKLNSKDLKSLDEDDHEIIKDDDD